MIDILHQKPLLGRQINWAHPLAHGLVACWVMNEGTGNKIFDLSGNGNDGTFTDVTWNATEKGIGTYYGTFASNFMITVSSSQIIDLPLSRRLSIAVLCRPNYNAVTNAAVLTWGGSDDLLVYPNDDSSGAGGIRVFWRDGDTNNVINFAGTNMNGIWTSYLCTFESGSQVGYQDGMIVDTFNDAIPVTNSFTNFRIGGWTDAVQPFGGDIAYVYLYDRILTSAEAMIIHHSPYIMFQQNRVRRFSIAPPTDEVGTLVNKGLIDGGLVGGRLIA